MFIQEAAHEQILFSFFIYLSVKNFAKLSTISFHDLNAIGNLAKDWYRQVFGAHLVSKTMRRKHLQVGFHIYLSKKAIIDCTQGITISQRCCFSLPLPLTFVVKFPSYPLILSSFSSFQSIDSMRQ